MTVSGFEDGYVVCEWFDDKHKRNFGSFNPAILALDDGMPAIA